MFGNSKKNKKERKAEWFKIINLSRLLIFTNTFIYIHFEIKNIFILHVFSD